MATKSLVGGSNPETKVLLDWIRRPRSSSELTDARMNVTMEKVGMVLP
jgi:hypothetical protein